jgi:hypothetical protein
MNVDGISVVPERIMAEMRSNSPCTERRKHNRIKLNRPGVVGVGHGHAIGEGIVSDLSEGGARLTIAREFGVPDEFVLLVSTEGESWRRCQVVRRAWCEIAVRFAA